jgi:glutathione peroxidase
MGQELSTENEIKSFVDSNFKVDFPMFSKIEVNGVNTHPIYKYLKHNCSEMRDEKKGYKNIPWNFAKFLVDADGKVIKFYSPKITPKEMMKDIFPLLI